MVGLGHVVSGKARYQTALFLHGFMGSAADWCGVTADLEAEYRCIAVDLPGHGSSLGLPPENYTIEGTAKLLLALLDELDVESPAIVGYSMGGRLALYLALRYPERCSTVILESTSPGIEFPAEREARRRSDDEKAARLETGDLEGFLNDWYRQPLFASLARHEETLKRTISARMRNDPVQLAKSLRVMGAGSHPSLWGELAKLRAPTLAVAGELDEKYVGISRRIAASSPNAHAAIVPDAGHNVHLEHPEAYLGLLRHFLSVLRTNS